MASKEQKALRDLINREIQNVKSNRWLTQSEKQSKIMQLTKVIPEENE
jgi:hypothetical protein